MRFTPGSRFGHFEIGAPLGEGGMGEVYRARDSRLQREVAIKTLPASFREDPERIARFEREAQALAAINHPNIAVIHGIEEEGAERGLVMELVEGETLAELLRAGRLPVNEARRIAMQIADALEAAHELGIVHRDLKPANIKIRPDGTVKVLDFGLAKVLSPDGNGAPALANSPTMTSASMTRAGVILGTAAYMSPEQARGRAVDKRADIWAFGCVLYEMLAGAPVFAGDNTTDLLVAVVQQEPDWSRLPKDVPAPLVALLRRCLQKDPRERLRDIGDARPELRGGNDIAIPPHVNEPPRRRAAVFVPAFVAGAAVGGLILYGLLTARTPDSDPPRPARLSINIPPPLALAATESRGSAVALSPDGSRVVFAAESSGQPSRLYLRRLDGFESTPIQGTEGGLNPFFSTDGEWVGFYANGQLKKVALAGGAPLTLGPVRALRGNAWLPDGSIVVTPANNAGLSRVPAGGTGGPETLTQVTEGELSHRWPSALPDGSTVLFSRWNDTGWDAARIEAFRIGSRERTVVLEGGGGYPHYVADPAGNGILLYARAEGLLATRFDPSALRATGTPVPVLDGILTNGSGGAHFTVSRDGTLAYVPGTLAEGDRDLVWINRDGSTSPAGHLTTSGRFYALDRASKRVLRVHTGAVREMWIEDLERGTSIRLTNGGAWSVGVWSKDEEWAFYGKGLPITNLYRVRTQAGATEERLTTQDQPQTPTGLSPDGKTLIYNQVSPTSSLDIYVLELPDPAAAPDGKLEGKPFLATRFAEGWARFSPDGRWVAYESNQSGRFEVYIRSFPDGQRTIQVSTEGGTSPVWSRKGNELFYRDVRGPVLMATVTDGPEAVTKPTPLFDARGYEPSFDVSTEGRFLMMTTPTAETQTTQINIILNFLQEIRQRLR